MVQWKFIMMQNSLEKIPITVTLNRRDNLIFLVASFAHFITNTSRKICVLKGFQNIEMLDNLLWPIPITLW